MLTINVTKKSVWWAFACVTVLGNSEPIIAGNDVFSFECNVKKGTFDALGHTFLIPDGFDVDQVEKNRLSYTEEGPQTVVGPLSARIVYISFGEDLVGNLGDWDQDLTGIGPLRNIDVKSMQQEQANNLTSYWYLANAGGEELLVVSFFEVDFDSLIGCIVQ